MSPDKDKTNNSHEYAKFVLQINDKLSLFFNRRRREKLQIHNPFVYKWKIKWYQWIKMAILSVLFLPIKLILVTFWLIISIVISSIITYNHDHNVPFSGWQKKLLPFFNVAARLTYFFGGIYWVKMKGEVSMRKDIPILVIAPHSAFLDSLVVVCLGNKSVLGKMESAKSCIGSLVKITQPVLVDREDPNSRQNTLDEIERRAALPNKWPQVVIFPEGTCTNRTCLINFKTGAFQSGQPVQPVVVKWPNRVDSVTWTWDGPGIFTLLWMSLSQFYVNLEIECLDPYYPSVEEKKEPKLYAQNVRAVMAEALNIPVTDYSYEDCRHMTMAKEAGLPFSEIIVEINKLCQFLLETYETVENSRVKLLEINQSFGAKKISANEFSTIFDLKSPVIEGVEAIFTFYDKNKTGTIFLRELLSHIFFFMSPFERKEALRYSVQAYTDSLYVDERDACNEVLQHVFSFTLDEVNEVFSIIQSTDSPENLINTETLEETLSVLEGPFNMYTDYFKRYNRSKRRKSTPKVSETKNRANDNTVTKMSSNDPPSSTKTCASSNKLRTTSNKTSLSSCNKDLYPVIETNSSCEKLLPVNA